MIITHPLANVAALRDAGCKFVCMFVRLSPFFPTAVGVFPMQLWFVFVMHFGVRGGGGASRIVSDTLKLNK